MARRGIRAAGLEHGGSGVATKRSGERSLRRLQGRHGNPGGGGYGDVRAIK